MCRVSKIEKMARKLAGFFYEAPPNLKFDWKELSDGSKSIWLYVARGLLRDQARERKVK